MTLIRCRKCWAQVSAAAGTCPRCGARLGNTYATVALVILLALAMVLIVIGIRQVDQVRPVVSHYTKAEALKALEFSYTNMVRKEVGTPMLIDITLANQGSRDVKDVMIQCDYLGERGNALDSDTAVVAGVLRTEETRHIKAFKMGLVRTTFPQATKCYVRNLTLESTN